MTVCERHLNNKKQIATLYWITSQIIIIFIFQAPSKPRENHQWRVLGSWWRKDGVTESHSLKVIITVLNLFINMSHAGWHLSFHYLLFHYLFINARSRDDLASSSQSDMFSSQSEDQWFSKEKLYKVENKSTIKGLKSILTFHQKQIFLNSFCKISYSSKFK